MGIFDWFKKKDNLKKNDEEKKDGLRQFHDPLFDFSNYVCNKNEQACSLDEIPEGIGEFGIEPTNPIPMLADEYNFAKPTRIYFSSLLTQKGERITWSRVGSLTVKNINQSVDKWAIFDLKGNHIKFIYVSLYHKKISQKSPKGFLLNSYRVALENDYVLGVKNFNPLGSRYMWELARKNLPKGLKDKLRNTFGKNHVNNEHSLYPREFIRVLTYAQSFLLLGPDEYRKQDYFKFPLREFDENELYFGAVQVFNYFKGTSPIHYIKLKNIASVKGLLLTLSHYQLIDSEYIENNLLKATFKHKLEIESSPPKSKQDYFKVLGEFKLKNGLDFGAVQMVNDITLYFKLSET